MTKVLGDSRAVIMRGHGATIAESSIEATFLACLHLEENARLLVEASILGNAKLQELATGGEAESSGSFESREDWAWEAVREPVEGGFGAERITLTVTYGHGGARKTLQLEQIVQ